MNRQLARTRLNEQSRPSDREAPRPRLGATLFRIDGLNDPTFDFDVLRVREAMPCDSAQAERLQRMADQLWRRELKSPVYPSSRFDFPGFIVPAGTVNRDRVIELPGVPDRTYHVEVTDQAYTVRADKVSGSERELVCRMIERAFTNRLLKLRHELWKGDLWTLFFRLAAENEDVATDIVRAFRGLRFGVAIVNGELSLAADARTRYIGRKSLAQATSEERQRILQGHLSPALRPDERAQFVRDNGTKKIACRYVGDVQQTAGEYTFDRDGHPTTVYTYYRQRYPEVRVELSDPLVFVQDHRGGVPLPVPANRLFPIFTTDYEAIRRCSVAPQLSPDERLRHIASFLPYLRDTAFGDVELTPRLEPLVGSRKVFCPPSLEFGNNVIVSPFDGASRPDVSTSPFDRGVLAFGSAKVHAVESQPPFHNEPLPDAVLLFPGSLSRGEREAFATILEQGVEKLTGQRLRIGRQVEYATGPGEREGTALLREAEQVLRAAKDSLLIPILWDGLRPSVHGAFKEAVSPAHSQCVEESNARTIATGRDPARLAGLVRNLVLGLITEVGVIPWVLSDSLHHDVHIGIDVLHGRIGYHALYGLGGRYITSESGTALHGGRAHEHIKAPEMRRRVEQILRRIAATDRAPDSLVGHRDGRWWDSDRRGFREAIEALQAEGVLPAGFRYALVEVRKNHLPVRLFTERIVNGRAVRANPLPGSYLLLDGERAILASTGRPGAWDQHHGRTAGTLLLEVVEAVGDFKLEEIVEDAYRLTHLNWSAPDIPIAHPVTIRWTDHSLRQTLRGETVRTQRWALEQDEGSS
jgi:hypothetical protein